MKNKATTGGGPIRSFARVLAASAILTVAVLPSAAETGFPSPVTAEGDVLIIGGRLTDRSGSPIAGGTVEFWQTDARGIYDHPGDRKTGNRDTGFQFYGSSAVDQEGNYLFRTILPGRYEPRPRHIHVKVRQNGRELLTTQIYFAEDGNTRGAGGSTENLRVALDKMESSDGVSYADATFDIVVDTGRSGTLQPTDRQSEGPYYPVADVSMYDNDLASIE